MTQLPFTELLALPDEVVLTYLDVLERQAEQRRKAGRKRG